MENNKTMQMPKELQQILGNQTYKRDGVGLSGSEVRLYEDMVLKIRPQSREAAEEHTMLCWLEGKLPAPRCLYHGTENGMDYLLMSRIPGKMVCDEAFMELDEGHRAVAMMAEGLKRLWQMDVKNCPCQQRLSKTLDIAQERICTGQVSMEEATPGVFGKDGFESPQALLDWLRANQPEEELTFSHGDYCLPNVLVEEGRLSGYIDLGNAGVADRWEDIAMAHRSLRNNFWGIFGGKVYEGFDPDWLFEALGIIKDEKKFRYFDLLHELY